MVDVPASVVYDVLALVPVSSKLQPVGKVVDVPAVALSVLKFCVYAVVVVIITWARELKEKKKAIKKRILFVNSLIFFISDDFEQ